jgi:4-hydroxy-tetrahydrodipicolinate reductase
MNMQKNKNQKLSAVIRLGVLGGSGKMGRSLTNVVVSDLNLSAQFKIVYVAAGSQDPNFLNLAKREVDVVIDFSAPKATVEMAKLCAKHKIPLLICTTGFADKELKFLERTLKRVPWALTPNTSLGVYALKRALRTVLEFLPLDYSVDIVDIHHQEKKDAPSGTAKLLQSEVQMKRGHLPPVHSIRAGTEAGEHQVHLMGPLERLELSHHAQDRSLFARGALRLAQKLIQLKARGAAYTVDDLFA